MDPWIMNIVLDHEINEIDNDDRVRMIQRNLRDQSNPFQMGEDKFKKMFRLTPGAALHLFEEIRVIMEQEEPQHRPNVAVPNHLKFCCALYFYSKGSYQSNIGQDYNIALSQPSVSRCVRFVSNIISTYCLNQYVKFPINPEEIANKKAKFMEKFNFPHVVGCVDGTHIAIIQPKTDDPVRPGINYLNRKNYYSINTQLICDADLKILAVNARFPGATHDQAIWQTSVIRRHLHQEYLRGTRNLCLLGDSGYALQPWLMTPILNVPEDTPEGRYTRAHIHARNSIERCIGVLKSRFRCLLKDRTLHYDPTMAGKIINTCVVLHNICVNYNIEFDEELMNDDADEDFENEIPENYLEPNMHRLSQEMQRNIVNYFR